MLQRTTPYVIQGHNGVLVGREVGREVQAQIVHRLEQLPCYSVLPLDFSQVKAINFSFADEAVVKVVRRTVGGDLQGRYIILQNVGEGPQEDIVAALKARQTVCVLEHLDGRKEVLGELSPELRETYACAVQFGKITARELIDWKEKDLGIAASSNRLARMRDMGLLVAVEVEAAPRRGRQNVFHPVG